MTLYPKAGVNKPHGPAMTPAGRQNPSAAAAFSPADIANLEAWYDASRITGLSDSDPVTTWADASSNGRDLAQVAAPTYRTSAGPAGKPSVYFDTDYMKTGSAGLIAQPFSVLLLIQAPLGTDAKYAADSRDTSNRFYFYQSATEQIFANAGVILATANDVITGSAQVWTFTLNGVSSSIRVNGSEVKAGSAGTSSWDLLTLGALNNGGGALITTYISELAVYTSLSTGDRDLVEAYLVSKYGI